MYTVHGANGLSFLQGRLKDIGVVQQSLSSTLCFSLQDYSVFNAWGHSHQRQYTYAIGRLGCHFGQLQCQRRVFKQCVTKGRVLNTKYVPESVMAFPVVVPGTALNVKNCAKLATFLTLRTNFSIIIVPQRVPFLWICASFANFCPFWVGVSVGRPCRFLNFPAAHPPPPRIQCMGLVRRKYIF